MMLKESKYKYWMMLANYDLDTVEVLIKGRRWVYVAFFCHQAVERQLKGMYVYYAGKEAPKTHNVSFLFSKIIAAEDFLEQADQQLLAQGQKDCEEYLIDAMYFYISDYPFSYKNIMSRFVDEKTGLELYARTQKIITWLRLFLPPQDLAEQAEPKVNAAPSPAGQPQAATGR
jgi:HEPN domain-containing protein